MNKKTFFKVPGLEQPVEILVDKWGIPHIYASSNSDLFFGQGFNAARDRLWQLDLWRRRGLGLLSEVLGPKYVEQDRAARLFLYRGDMDAEWPAYSADTKQIMTSFTAGINAYIELTQSDPAFLPEEFTMLGYRPLRWQPEDVVRIRSHGLLRNVVREVARAQTLHKYGKDVELIRQRLEPEWDFQVPEGLDLEDIPEDVLEVYLLAKEKVIFDRDDKQPTPQDLHDRIRKEASLGSNSWVIGPEKSATGRPILANDPHRAMTLPSLRYMVHLSAPGFDAIGGGEPVLPGISIGHNGQIAFGLTIFAVDQEDLYVYKTNPENDTEYWYAGQWESMDIITEKVLVKGHGEQLIEMAFTRHGPVIYQDKQKNRAFAVRAAWLQPGMAPYLGSLAYMRATNWEQFYETMNTWGSPSENQVYADTEGNIGWKPGGLTPVRPNWDGLLPVPGDGTYEWAGFLNQENYPSEYNPKRGWIATANQMNLPDDFPYAEHKVGFEWAASYRYQRIATVLKNKEKVTIADSVALQSDYVTVSAKRLKQLLKPLQADDKKLQNALDMLAAWDGELAADSAAGCLYEVWYKYYLCQAVVHELMSKEAAAELDTGDPVVILRILESVDPRLGKDPQKARDQILLTSLRAAITYLENALGTDMKQWAWGDLHHMHFKHPLSNIVNEQTQQKLNVGPFKRGGSDETPGNTTYDKQSFEEIHGASFRVVIDVGNWDGSVAVNSPGQSGDPQSEHYADLAPIWAQDQAIPLLYTREKIEEVTLQTIILQPAT